MTLIVGLRCTDGIVMAADSQTTEAAPGGGPRIARHETASKIRFHRALLWGCSGFVGTAQIIDEAIKGQYGAVVGGNPSAVELRKRLVKIMHPLAVEQYKIVALASGGAGPIPHVQYIFGTYLERDGFALVNIEHDMNGEVVEAAHCAAGSAQKTAQALLCRLRHQEWSLQMGKAIAYRTMEDAIWIEPEGISEPIHLAKCYLVKKGQPTCDPIEGAEYSEARDMALSWRKIEQEALEGLLAGAGQEPTKADIPEPSPPGEQG